MVTYTAELLNALAGPDLETIELTFKRLTCWCLPPPPMNYDCELYGPQDATTSRFEALVGQLNIGVAEVTKYWEIRERPGTKSG